MSIAPIDISKVHGFGHAYPYTDFHELNVDWLLTTYNAILQKVNETIAWANTQEATTEEIVERLEAVEGEITGFETEVNARFDALKADLEADFAQQKAELDAALIATKAEVAQAIFEMRQQVERELASFEERYQALKAEVDNAIRDMKAEVNRAIMSIQGLLEANNEYVFQYVENRLDEFINSLPDITTVYVYNPYRGEVTDLQTAINDVYSVASIWGLTAQQYDSLGLTAEEYDNLGLSATEYDTMGYKLLYKDPNYYMISPFTGLYVPVKDVVMDLAQLHIGGVTAAVYDAKELTAEEYDALELTAFNYDWFGQDLLPA